MKERPILFSAPMVLALLAGRKTQTRRVVKNRVTGPNPPFPPGTLDMYDVRNTTRWRGAVHAGTGRGNGCNLCPYGLPGDRLWVRETWCWYDGDYGRVCEYRAENPDPLALKWMSPIFMPRRLSRIDLDLIDVRVERLQDISEADAAAEGVERDTSPCDHTRASCADVGCLGPTHRAAYGELWEQINGAGSWAANPWVWVLAFRVLRP